MRKPLFKAVAALLAILLLAAAIFLVNLVWFRPFSLNLFYEKIFIGFLLEQPELLSTLGVAEQFGYRRHADLLVAIAHAMGDPIAGFGDTSSGPLPGLLA